MIANRQKKVTALIVFLVIFMNTTIALIAEEIPAPYMRFGIWGDLMHLYPETDYFSYPSDLTSIKDPVLFNYMNFYFSEDETLDTRSPATATGKAGGTYDQDNSYLGSRVSLTGFYPLNNGMVLGVGGYTNLTFDRTDEKYLNYYSDPENIIKFSEDDRQRYAASYYFAKKTDSFDYGVYGSIDYTIDPYEESWTANGSVNNGEAYITSGIGDELYSSTRYKPSITGSFSTVLDKLSVQFGVSADMDVLGFQRYITVDKDGNGYADVYVLKSDYEKSTESWGANPTDPNTDYSYYNTQKVYNIGIMPALTYEVSDTLSLILNGYADIFSSGEHKFYEHFDSTDKNVEDIVFSNSSYRANAAVNVLLFDNIELRVGGGYTRDNYKRKTNNLDSNGDSVYQTENTNHYAEVNWATAPDNDDVITAAYSANNSHTDTVEVLTGLQWQVAPKVVLFSRAELSFSSTSKEYNVFNTADNTIWTEVEKSNNLNWDLTTVAGAGITISDSLFLGLQADWFSGRTSSEDDSLPIGNNTESTAATTDLHSILKDNYFSINIFFVIGL